MEKQEKKKRMNKIKHPKINLNNSLNNSGSAIVNFFANCPHIWLAFMIPFAAMAGAYAYFGVYPLGEKSVLSLDLNAQYVHYFVYMKDAIFGDESILYSWSRNLSGEFVGIIGYYLFSPFNFLVYMMPLEHTTEGLLLMLLTKIGTIGVTMSIYLSKSRGFSKHTSLIFSIMYALLSYNIVQTMNPMWLDGVIALPLVVMGIESLVKHGKYKLLIVSLVYSFVTCFYIGYMVAIFTVLYYVYYILTSHELKRENLTPIMKRTGLFVSAALVAGMLSAFMLLPVYSSLTMGKLDFSNPDYGIRANFEILDMTRKLFPNSYDTVRMDGKPFIFCGTLALIMMPAYFFCKRIRRARRFGGIALIAILITSMVVTPLDMFWHGMQNPNWLPYRYSFMLCFLFLKFGAEAFENIRKIPYKVLGLSAAAFFVLLIFHENADTVIPGLGGDPGRDVFEQVTVALPAMLMLLLFAGIVIMGRNKLNKHNLFTAALVALVSLDMMYNAQLSIEKQNTDIVYSSRQSYNSVILPTREVTDRILKDDKSFYRMEKTFIRSACDSMSLRMKGMTHSSSMLNDKAIALLKSLGYASRSHMSRYSGNTPLTDDLFGFKYRLSCVDDSTGNIKSADDITVTQNEDVLDIAFLADPKITELSFEGEKGDDVFTNQNRMLSYMLGDEYKEYFKRIEVVQGNDEDQQPNPDYIDEDDDNPYYARRRPQNLKFEGRAGDYKLYSRGEKPIDAHIEYDFVAEHDGSIFMYFPSHHERKCNLYVKRDVEDPDTPSKFLGVYYETDHYYIRHIGDFKKGEKFMVTLSLTGADVFFRDEQFMWLDTALLEADIAKLHQLNSNTEFKAKSNRSFQIKTNNDKETILFTTIPIEPGWKASINGKNVDIVGLAPVWSGTDPETNEDIFSESLMGIKVPAGEYTIELKFFPELMREGIIITFAGLIAFFAMGMYLTNRKGEKGGKAGKDRKVDDVVLAEYYDGFDDDYVEEDSYASDN